MRDIVAKHYPKADEDVVSKSIEIFYQLRQLGLERAPSTRELLNWLKYLQTFAKEDTIKKIQELDGLGALVKTQDDVKRVKRNMDVGNAPGGTHRFH